MLTLNKSLYEEGDTCKKRMWLLSHEKKDEQEITLYEQMLVREGEEVLKLARSEFPKGILVEEANWNYCVKKTRELIFSDSPIIFEAAFEISGMRMKADIILKLRDNRYRLIEVKSGTKPNEYLTDVAFQVNLLSQSGLIVKRAEVMCLDRDRVYGDSTLFKRADVTDLIEPLLPEIQQNAPSFLDIINSDIPKPEYSSACKSCEFTPHCYSTNIEYPVYELYRGGKKIDTLLKMGVFDLCNIVDQIVLNKLQQRQVKCIKDRRPWYSRNIKSFLQSLAYPLYFLDFETIQPAIPMFEGQHPYDRLPFQWSCHIRHNTGDPLEHRSFLHDGSGDPRYPFIESLIETLGNQGTIIVYSNYEKTILTCLQKNFPKCDTPLEQIKDRLFDLLKFVREHYYHPDFHGGFSIKSILPHFEPSFDYENLTISDGLEAGAVFQKILHGDYDEAEKEQMMSELEKYCAYDTLAMVKILKSLESIDS